MTCIGEEVVTGGSIPDMDGVVVTARGDVLSIGGPGHRSYCIPMAHVGEKMIARRSIPDVNGLIVTGRSKELAIRGPGNTSDGIGVTVIGVEGNA